jgi:hypothetical protein
MKLSHPVSYSVADHAARIFRTEAYKKAAAQFGKTPEQFQNEVAEELKRIVAEEHAKELADFEQAVGTRALAAAVEKAKAKQAA